MRIAIIVTIILLIGIGISGYIKELRKRLKEECRKTQENCDNLIKENEKLRCTYKESIPQDAYNALYREKYDLDKSYNKLQNDFREDQYNYRHIKKDLLAANDQLNQKKVEILLLKEQYAKKINVLYEALMKASIVNK